MKCDLAEEAVRALPLGAPTRVQLRRTRGWRMPANTIKVARPGPWGNPYPVEEFGLELALALFENSLTGVWNPALMDKQSDELTARANQLHSAFLARHARHPLDEARAQLGGINLACFCPPTQPCHVDILLRYVN